MNIMDEIQEKLDDIKEKQATLDDMFEAWENGDECEQACSDPSDQFCLREEIERDLIEFKKYVNENI